MDPKLIADIVAGRHAKASSLADALNMSRQAFYDAIARKEVAAIRIGKTIRVPAKEASRLLGLEPPQPIAA